ncbi:hypothetical protein MTo_02223 [Microcystis aeruginosa NIES-1211]|uniref:hypothetical protein n=1 Tax=Microcystis TaxID=1125 RepID=UPI000D964967|nr:hypothetical protein [Microcystis aeruginosa]GBL14915.1 hypothetical protein MTo_02223 [Microcystis aeruginosa NIES-1211]GCA83888.1 hypothetical protein MiHa_01857 [Microcystis aeruginosa NIES-2522]GCA88313.1 hypothetical protein MiTa_01655 [Microcystis aeruginosa NIES-4264]
MDLTIWTYLSHSILIKSVECQSLTQRVMDLNIKCVYGGFKMGSLKKYLSLGLIVALLLFAGDNLEIERAKSNNMIDILELVVQALKILEE